MDNLPIYKEFPSDLSEPPQTVITQQKRCQFKTIYIVFSLIFLLTLGVMILIWKQHWYFLSHLEAFESYGKESLDDSKCHIQLVESIPENLNFSAKIPSTLMSTYDAWKLLLTSTEASLDIAAYYWSLRGVDVINDTTAAAGEDIFQRITDMGSSGGVKIRVVQSIPTKLLPDLDTFVLQNEGVIELRTLNFTRLLGDGVLHTKFWISDNKHAYIGSANMDWRALTQVKEMGVLAMNCPTLVMDLKKIFKAYWVLATNTSSIPTQWPFEYSTNYNIKNPMRLSINDGQKQNMILSNSPPALTAYGRVDDIKAILHAIATAEEFVNIAVMSYIPMMIFSKEQTFWPVIDDALRSAAIDRKIHIKLLISWWKHSNPAEDYFLRSLKDLSNALPDVDIQIKRITLPENERQSLIPFARVNHAKFMVTDNIAYIGTSNWSGDYFTSTAGVGLVFPETPQASEEGTNRNTTLRQDLLNVFQRDWNSPYTRYEDFS